MKKNFKNSMVSFAILAAFAVAFTSCNRGMGCPNNFSLEQTIVSSILGGADVPTID